MHAIKIDDGARGQQDAGFDRGYCFIDNKAVDRIDKFKTRKECHPITVRQRIDQVMRIARPQTSPSWAHHHSSVSTARTTSGSASPMMGSSPLESRQCGEMRSPVDVTYLADTVILLRYFEAMGQVRRAVSVLKKRTGAHENTIRDFTIDRNGLNVGVPIEGFQGVLRGVPQYLGASARPTGDVS